MRKQMCVNLIYIHTISVCQNIEKLLERCRCLLIRNEIFTNTVNDQLGANLITANWTHESKSRYRLLMKTVY